MSSNPPPKNFESYRRSSVSSFRLVRRMNQGGWKRFWTWCQKIFGAGWIHLATYNLMHVYGLEHCRGRFARASDPAGSQPSIVLRHVHGLDRALPQDDLAQATFLSGARPLLLPVAAGFVCESGHGLVVDVSALFSLPAKNRSRRSAPLISIRFALLTELARTGAGNVIGFHPEGTRNKGADPYSYLPAQPGIGKLIKDAAPQVIPVFIAGLGNDLAETGAGKLDRRREDSHSLWTAARSFGAPVKRITCELTKRSQSL